MDRVQRGWRRRSVAAVVAASLAIGGGLPVAAQEVDDGVVGPPSWADEVAAAAEVENVTAPPWPEGTRSAPVLGDEGVEPAEPVLPASGRSEVALGRAGEAAAVGRAPIEITAGEGARGARLAVEVLDRPAAERAGVSGFVFRVDGADGKDLASSLRSAAGGRPAGAGVELTVGYSEFKDLYGAGYADRMRVVALPACALDEDAAQDPECDRDGVPLPTRLDLEAEELVVEIDDLVALEADRLAPDHEVLGPPLQVADRSGQSYGVPTPEDEASTAVREGGAEEPEGEAPAPAGTGGAESGQEVTASGAAVGGVGSRAGEPEVTLASASVVTKEEPTTTTAAEDGDGESGGAASTTSTTTTSTTIAGGGSSGPDDVSDSSSTTSSTVPEAEDDAGGAPLAEDGSGTEAATLTASDEQGVVLAVTSGVSGDAGSWTATPLSLTADWNVGLGSGEFSWSYPVEVPDAPAGPVPEVGLAYSSGAVDGLVSSRNPQGNQTGIGWGDFASSFIERRYIPCRSEDAEPEKDLGDLCWKDDNAVLSLNGRTSELVREPIWGYSYRLKDDPGWRVDRVNEYRWNGDNDGERWRVTTPDGTQYWFGYEAHAEEGVPTTNSVWTVPVVANHWGEPCRAEDNKTGVCTQAWRWNLDKVVDRHGNMMVYVYGKEQNHYGLLNGWTDAEYTRAGHLKRIAYGKREGSSALGTAKVEFETWYRCGYLTPNCPHPVPESGSGFPDVPSELLCDSDCVYTSPTFFSAKRYVKATTFTRPDASYQPVDEVRLTHSWVDDTEGNEKLWLNGIQRKGVSESSAIDLPAASFWPTLLDNRVDYNLSLGVSPMKHPRISTVLDEFGGVTEVTYGQPNPCPKDPYPNGGWDTNALDCFPQKWQPDGAPAGFGIFHKWLVTKVERQDPTGGSPAVATNYAYTGGAAWHHDADDFVKLADQSWSDWRGYGTALVVNQSSASRYRLFRGMHGDRLAGGGSKTANVSSFDGSVTRQDSTWMAGRVLDEQELSGGWTIPERSTLTDYTVEVTAERPDPADSARFVAPEEVTESRRTPVAGAVKTRTSYTYVARRAQVETVHESGWLGESGDERCTKTTYATDAFEWMVDFPASEVVVKGACSSTDELSHTEWYYDGSNTLGEIGALGEVTKTRTKIDSAEWSPFTHSTYDNLGRPTSTTDPAGDETTTVYAPATGNPSTITVTNPAGHASVTTLHPRRRVPTREEDANGNVTTIGYDALGRLRAVRLPTEQPYEAGKPPSIEYHYDIAPGRDDEPVVRTRRVTSNDLTRFEDSWVVYDSLLRERQTQRLSPAEGKLVVAETSYDNKGQLATQTTPQAVDGTPGERVTGVAWDNSTAYTYDDLGRETKAAWQRDGTEAWATTTAYTHNSVQVTPPEGGDTLTVHDAYGNEVQVSEHDGTDWQSAGYTYDLTGNLTTVVDQAGNETTYGYDLAGRRTTQDDADAGQWSYDYDDAGNRTTVTDGEGSTIYTRYDPLGRPTERRHGSATGTLLASFTYDTAPGGIGLPATATRHTTDGDWTTSVDGYDGRGRPTAQTLSTPAGLPGGLSGDYTTTYSYDPADRHTQVTYPAVGDLPQESVTMTYNDLGQPESMVGDESYVRGISYDNRARPWLRSSGDETNWAAQSIAYDQDQRVGRITAANPTATVMDHTLSYDTMGQVTERDSILGTASWTECFGYDDRHRVTDAFTVDPSSDCDTGTPGGGDVGYEHAYTYSADGNLTERVEDGTAHTYSYPAGGPGTVRPHAPTAVDGDSYSWDDNGRLEQRTVNGETETFTWSPEHLLESIDGPDGQTSFVYGPGGDRLLRTTPDAATLYVGNHEATVDATTGDTTAVRTYSFAGQVIATRTADGVDYLFGDQQGSIQIAMPSGTTGLATTRSYLPYGNERGTTGDPLDTDRGWLGQIEDQSTELSYLNARYYDPHLARFISPDPVYHPDRPGTLNPYSYGINNPTTLTDPSGMDPPCAHPGVSCSPTTKAKQYSNHAYAGSRGNQAYAQQVYKNTLNEANADTLRQMKAGCSGPGCAALYKALAAAGSPGNLKLMAMRNAVPDPAFWRWLDSIGPAGVKRVKRALELSQGSAGDNSALDVRGDISDKKDPVNSDWCKGGWRNPLRWDDCLPAGYDSYWASGRADALAGPDTHPGLNNALRHCMWSAIMTWHGGESMAQGFLTRHEEKGGSFKDTLADLNNNGVGIAVGKSESAAWVGSAHESIENQCVYLANNDGLDLSGE